MRVDGAAETPTDPHPPSATAAGIGSPTARVWIKPVSPVLPPPFALVEILILVALVALEYFWDGFPALTRINPHPYWIAILLLSLQYGTVSGLAAASIAIVGTVLIGMPVPEIEERYFNYLIRVWTQPVLWLLVALLLGTFRARQIEQRDELLQQAENLRVRGTTLLDYANALRARCTVLERRLATRQTGDASALLASLAHLATAAPARWGPALEAALDAGFPGAVIAIYARDGDAARLIVSHDGSPGTAAHATAEIAADHPLATHVLGHGLTASVLDPADDTALRGLGVAAVPILDAAASGSLHVIGLVLAIRLPPAQIDALTPQRLAVIAAHVAPALQSGQVAAPARHERADSPVILAAQPPLGPVPAVSKWRLAAWLPGAGRGTTPERADG